MNVRTKYFHAVMPYKWGTRPEQLEEELYKLECIMKSGYILPYKEVKKRYPDVKRHPSTHNNGEDRISICRHTMAPDDPIEREILRENRHRLMEYAFDMFPGEETAIVLNESLKKDFDLLPKGIYLERQVREPIPLSYMDAISINPTEKITSYFPAQQYKEPTCWSENYFTLTYLRRVRRLLNRYKHDVPIVSAMTGNEFQDRVNHMVKK